MLKLGLLWCGWCGLHSLLITATVRRWLEQRGGVWLGAYRLVYVGLSMLTLLPLLWYTTSLPQQPLPALPLWLRIPLLLYALVMFVGGLRVYDLHTFLGLRQWRSGTRDAADAEAFRISPFHRHVRHPWYAFGLVVLWTRDMSAAMLVSAVLTTVYLVVGAHLEEKKLVARLGDAYRGYQRRVPGLIPLPWKSISAEEAEDITALAARERTSPPPAR